MRAIIRHAVNCVLFFVPPTRFFFLRRTLLRWAGVKAADGAKVCGGGWIFGPGELVIGTDTWMSPKVVVYTHRDVVISIGVRCDIGPGVQFVPGGHELGACIRRAGVGTVRAISVGDGCWVGANSVLLGGVSIGPGCVVAAGAVVTRSFAANTLIAGVPATAKRRLDR